MNEYNKDELVPLYNCSFHCPAGNAVTKAKRTNKAEHISHSIFKSTHESRNVVTL